MTKKGILESLRETNKDEDCFLLNSVMFPKRGVSEAMFSFTYSKECVIAHEVPERRCDARPEWRG